MLKVSPILRTDQYDGKTTATLDFAGAALVGVVTSDDVTLNTNGVTGAFADANVGMGKAVHVNGLTISGADAGNYTLTEPIVTAADITAAATSTLLMSSENPSATGSNVTFTATVSSGAGNPGGEVVFLVSGLPFSTNALVAGVAATSTDALPLGTNTVTAQYAAQVNYLGSTGTVQQVVRSAVVYSQTNAIASLVNNGDGTFTLSFVGTPQAEYYVVTSTDLETVMSGWEVLPNSTNTAPAPSGVWSVTVTNDALQRFYRSAAVNPGP